MITFEGDVFQTPKNKTQEAVPMSKSRKHRGNVINRTFPVEQVPRWEEQPRSRSYDAELSVTAEGEAQPLGRFTPPHPTNADNFASGSSDDSPNLTTVYNGANPPRNMGIQTSPG